MLDVNTPAGPSTQAIREARAGRATGAMFFIVFGAMWLEGWCWLSERAQVWPYYAIAAVAVVFLVGAVRVFRANKPEPSALAPTDERRRVGRRFHIVNAAQWVLILVGVNVLNNIGLAQWAFPFIILIVGLHFLPLARLFKNPPHYVTGLLLVLLAVVYPLMSVGGPQNPVGLLGAGLILWASALWAIAGKPFAARAGGSEAD